MKDPTKISAIPLELAAANELVDLYHDTLTTAKI